MKKIALIFPGQASQYVGMGKAIYEKYPFVKELVEEANSVLGFNLKELCFNGSLDELTKTENTQPAILACSVAAFKVFKSEHGVMPAFAAGHSIGEISALTCAGAIKFADALKIVKLRGKFMQEAVPVGHGKMVAVTNTDSSQIESICSSLFKNKDAVVISNYNAPSQLVISGLTADVDLLSENLKKSGVNVIPLKVSAPFHSPHMEPAAIRMKEELLKYSFYDFDFPVISNVNAQPYSNPALIVERLVKQIVAPVKWQESMEYFVNNKIDGAFEIGPKNVLKNLMAKNAPQITTYSLDDINDEKTLKGKFKTFVAKCLGIAVSVKNRNWNDAEYLKGVSVPFKKVQQAFISLEQVNEYPDLNLLKEAFEMLNTVMETKLLPQNERVIRFEQLFGATGLEYLFPEMQQVLSVMG